MLSPNTEQVQFFQEKNLLPDFPLSVPFVLPPVRLQGAPLPVFCVPHPAKSQNRHGSDGSDGKKFSHGGMPK
ncbi:hypothetical protein [Brevibacillus massiliensis]|jgi:hypothetical protein|uniref:hypothetical protein n=1 Tax=Brevibacillus massiliensis TaxID=1118054 RepID=UPI0002DD2696|nr:hypothetical protein [Brevibacillus massiliensis]